MIGATSPPTTPAPQGRAAARARTLQVMDLLQTRVQSVRIELVGGESSPADRLGTWLVFLPILVVGYALVLSAALGAVHHLIGWGATLLLFGAAHLGVGVWGVLRAPTVGAVTRDAVLDARVANPTEPPAAITRDSSDAVPRVRLPSLPLPLRMRVPKSEGPAIPGV